MLQFDQERVKALHQAISYDGLVLHQKQIMEEAQESSPALHKRTVKRRNQQLLSQLIRDAAGEDYKADELPLLLNCVIWSNRPFYRESPYRSLFTARLLLTKERVQQLFLMLKLIHHARLSGAAYFAPSLKEPLVKILERINGAHLRLKSTQQGKDKSRQLDKALIRIETQSLLTTLVKEILGDSLPDWQALETVERHEYLHIENPRLHRRLLLMTTDESILKLEGTKEEGDQLLRLALPASCREADIEQARSYLQAYLVELEAAQELARERLAEPQKEKQNA